MDGARRRVADGDKPDGGAMARTASGQQDTRDRGRTAGESAQQTTHTTSEQQGHPTARSSTRQAQRPSMTGTSPMSTGTT